VGRLSLRLVLLSDTHLREPEVPDGDLLVHAGDLTLSGSLEEIGRAARWLRSLPHRHKVVIAGNHDFAFQQEPFQARLATAGLTYLEDESATVAGLRVYGSPWQPWVREWAFSVPEREAIASKWRQIPDGIQVLVTHVPPRDHGDFDGARNVGCPHLRDEVEGRVRPLLHVFGHVHQAYGRYPEDGIEYVNACACDITYRPVNPPLVIDLPAGLSN
jgi:Icc-related predicted phosphoesterase